MKGMFILSVLSLAILLAGCAGEADREKAGISRSDIKSAERLAGLEFTPSERDSMLQDLSENLESYRKLREIDMENSIPPALVFNPVPAGREFTAPEKKMVVSPAGEVKMPDKIEKLAFYTVRELAELIRTGKITSVQLTELCLKRLKRYDPLLKCVVTLTEEQALEQARRADKEIAAGRYRSLLHGIPYGVKDLLATRYYHTTWGAEPFRDQLIDRDAVVIRKLEEAGAVLVAKLTLGALAWGDVWFGGMTRNPWNTEEGSSGSSAGPASAVSAGLVPFAIGTETWGSIVSPSTRCGTTGLRPTFGRVSRAGAMALSWSMDKVGPICRTAEDCAIVFEHIRGGVGEDQSVINPAFNYDYDINLRNLRIGYLRELFREDYPGSEQDSLFLGRMEELGAELIPVDLPDYPVMSMAFILSAEAAAAFDRLTRSGRDELLTRQVRNAWPNVFRASRFIPAVEYIQANRLRYMLIQDMDRLDVDLYFAPSFGGDNLLLTNLTGHPCVVLPNGFDDQGSPLSVSIIGRPFGEGTILAVARLFQEGTDFEDRHPEDFTE
ncbi:MAG: amidase [Candidatus Latescibacteria bacterium]|nr:amidase [bacterium]MBD3423619.1 amidase [Candidatus Latescibacterota bacterium]